MPDESVDMVVRAVLDRLDDPNVAARLWTVFPFVILPWRVQDMNSWYRLVSMDDQSSPCAVVRRPYRDVETWHWQAVSINAKLEGTTNDPREAFELASAALRAISGCKSAGPDIPDYEAPYIPTPLPSAEIRTEAELYKLIMQRAEFTR